MRAPDFWYPKREQDPGSWARLAPALLAPLASLYDLVGETRRKWASPYRPSVPVVCVGNLTAGGTGKTPIAIEIGKALQAAGRQPFFLTRGYGGLAEGPLNVDLVVHKCDHVGDEALMLAQHAPTIVSSDRPKGAELACRLGAGTIVMDDGYQNPSLVKDVSVLIVDAELEFGNRRIIPAGPLREHVGPGLERADVVIVARKQRSTPSPVAPELKAHGEAISAWLGCEAQDLGKARPAIAFAGIANPEKFFAAVRNQNYHIVGTQAFPDHHTYDEDEFRALLDWSKHHDALLVTTEKDAMRLSPSQRNQVEIVPLDVTFDDPDALKRVLAKLSRKDAVLRTQR